MLTTSAEACPRCGSVVHSGCSPGLLCWLLGPCSSTPPVPAEEEAHIRVLSLFDGIATGESGWHLGPRTWELSSRGTVCMSSGKTG